MKAFLFLRSLVAFLLLAGCISVRAAAESAGHPNILFILADDMGPGDLGCYGGKQAPTPRIDQLAKEGTRFTQYYSASPICSPSRAGIITGMYPARWRITSFLQTKKGNAGCEQDDFLDPKAPSLPRALKGAGYTTAHFGKWHLGGGRDVTEAPKFVAYGYDEHAGTYESPEPHPDITATNWIWSDQDKVKRWDRTAFFVDKTLDFLARHREQPCFVNLWADDVHTPWVPDETSDKKDLPRNFRPVLAEFDKQIGRLLDGLRSLGMAENTIVVFASDNGALPTFNGDRSGGFRAGKLALYEGGIRMPHRALAGSRGGGPGGGEIDSLGRGFAANAVPAHGRAAAAWAHTGRHRPFLRMARRSDTKPGAAVLGIWTQRRVLQIRAGSQPKPRRAAGKLEAARERRWLADGIVRPRRRPEGVAKRGGQ
jgi:arylsulfatase A-like enzyme